MNSSAITLVAGGLDGPATTAVVKESLEALGLSRVDLMLIHFPAAWNGTDGKNRVVRLGLWCAFA